MTNESPEEPSNRQNEDPPIEAVHDQYWNQLRHVETEMWSFTRIWALILTAIFAFLGTDFEHTAKIGAAFFGVILSILGYLSVYTLRVPFLDYTWKIDLLSYNEFGLPKEYRVVDGDTDYRFDHGIDVPDVLIGLYTLVAALLVFIIGFLTDRTFLGIGLSVLLTLGLIAFYKRVVEREFERTIEQVADHYSE